METNEAPKEKKYSNWFLAEYYFRKVVAWFMVFIAIGELLAGDTVNYDDYSVVSAGLFVLAGVYLLVNTKKE